MNVPYKEDNICAVIVCYRVEINEFMVNISRHLKNFSTIILVNNSPEISLESFQSPQVTIINNQGNIGLAAALNIGILEAKKQGADMVALFDQDTEIPQNFAKKMLNYISNYKCFAPVALYAPIFNNRVTDKSQRYNNYKPSRLIPELVDEIDYSHPNYVISSGSLIPMDVIDDVGLMCEELFIDFVDTEWCLRARRKGYEIVAINKVRIDHYLGDYMVQFMGRSIPIHSPLRMYYYFRNGIYLYQLGEIDWCWRLVDAMRNLQLFLFYMLFVKNRSTYFKYSIKGYYHGLIKRMGKLEE